MLDLWKVDVSQEAVLVSAHFSALRDIAVAFDRSIDARFNRIYTFVARRNVSVYGRVSSPANSRLSKLSLHTRLSRARPRFRRCLVSCTSSVTQIATSSCLSVPLFLFAGPHYARRSNFVSRSRCVIRANNTYARRECNTRAQVRRYSM